MSDDTEFTDAERAAIRAAPRRYPDIEGVEFEIYPTSGEIRISRSYQPPVHLTAKETHTLFTFLRKPEVAKMIKQVEAARRAQLHHEVAEQAKRR